MTPKFRAFDHFNDCYHYSNKHKNLADFFSMIQKLIEGDNNIVLEQYIGRNDSEGIEICEGDLVMYEGTETDNSGLNKVIYEEDFARFSLMCMLEPDVCSTIMIEPDDKIKIVGNERQNPEMWKEEHEN